MLGDRSWVRVILCEGVTNWDGDSEGDPEELADGDGVVDRDAETEGVIVPELVRVDDSEAVCEGLGACVEEPDWLAVPDADVVPDDDMDVLCVGDDDGLRVPVWLDEPETLDDAVGLGVPLTLGLELPL